MENQQKLLKNYIKLLVEDGEAGTGYYGSHGYYMMVEPSALANIVMEPLRNFFKVAEGESKKLFSTGKMAVKLSFGVLANMIPGINVNLNNIFKVRQEEINAIEKQYSGFYDAALGLGNKDLKTALFLWNPSMFLAGTVLVGSSKMPKKVWEFFKSEVKTNKADYSFKDDEPKIKKSISVDKSELAMLTPSLVSMTNNYKNSFFDGMKKVLAELSQIKTMSDEEFIKVYAKDLGDSKKLYDEANKQLAQIKKGGKEQAAAEPKDAVKLIEDKKKQIVQQGKSAIFKLYLKSFKEQKAKIVNELASMSKTMNVNVDAESHGQIKAIDEAIKKIEKLKASV